MKRNRTSEKRPSSLEPPARSRQLCAVRDVRVRFIDSPPTPPYNGLRFRFHGLPALTMASLSQRKLSRVVGGFKAFLKQAFAVARGQDALSLDDLALLERVADAVLRLGVAAPATV